MLGLLLPRHHGRAQGRRPRPAPRRLRGGDRPDQPQLPAGLHPRLRGRDRPRGLPLRKPAGQERLRLRHVLRRGVRARTRAEDRAACSFCPKLCRHACPAAQAEASEAATPTFKQQVALRALERGEALDTGQARVLYKCTDCRGTVDACRHRISVAESLREARALAVQRGVAPREVHELARRVREHGSPYARDLEAVARGVAPEAHARRGALGVFPACAELARAPEDLARALALLRAAGAAPSLASPGRCCGYPLDAAGLREDFERHAAGTAHALAAFDEVLATGPSCAYTLAVRYRELGLRPPGRVLPLVVRLAAAADRWRGLAPAEAWSRRAAYHDPCFLARRLGRLREPRELLSAATGRPPLELAYREAETRCSGGGGVYPLTHPAAAARCGAAVLELAREAEADVLVTACPAARWRLARARRPGDPEVRSLVSVLAERTGLASPD
ncbi:MAG: (Fe-S)-binding protein [Planctomycetota bacterium]|nr:MAG: (Fe-S)-binding protein [Planctomycetota bacterium]